MKFSEPKKICKAIAYNIVAVDDDGNRTVETISMSETVDAALKLAKYDDADLISCRPCLDPVGDDFWTMLEVVVRV